MPGASPYITDEQTNPWSRLRYAALSKPRCQSSWRNKQQGNMDALKRTSATRDSAVMKPKRCTHTVVSANLPSIVFPIPLWQQGRDSERQLLFLIPSLFSWLSFNLSDDVLARRCCRCARHINHAYMPGLTAGKSLNAVAPDGHLWCLNHHLPVMNPFQHFRERLRCLNIKKYIQINLHSN